MPAGGAAVHAVEKLSGGILISRGKRAVTDFQLDYFEVWRPLRNAVLCGTVLHSLMHGEADDIDPVTIALSTFARLQADLAKSLSQICRRGAAP